MFRVIWRFLKGFIFNLLFPTQRIGNVLKVTYFYGTERAIYIPLKIEPQHKTILYKNNKEIDITQQGGVPYLVNSDDFEGEKIVIFGLVDDYTFEGKEVPGKI